MRVIKSEQKRNSSVTTFDGGWSYRKARKKPNSVTMLYNSHKINKTSKQECVCALHTQAQNYHLEETCLCI